MFRAVGFICVVKYEAMKAMILACEVGRNQTYVAKMSLCVSLILILPTVVTHGFEIQLAVCGDGHIAYSKFPGHEVFYVNGLKVEKELLCKELMLHHSSCLENYIPNTICALDLSAVRLSYEPSRKLLLSRDKEATLSRQVGRQNRKHTFISPVIGMAIPGVFLLCCVFLCPCFQSRRKEIEKTVLPNEPTSTNSASSFDISTNPEKTPRTPSRHVAASPFHHVPPSPFRHAPPSPRSSAPIELARLDTVHLNYSDIAKATQNFSAALIVGEGGFATVYKGRLQDGRVVAVKRAKKEHFGSAEFDSEVRILSKIDHRNLVKLLGYVDKGNERIIITEYVPNGTLRQHLDGELGRTLDFNQRLEVAIDIAHGLTYLHLYGDKQIIHRDVKSSNILLTESLRAKVADFGFAKVGPESGDDTHVLTKVKGTFGYVDPEYMRTYQLTSKSDVYSFGILLLEILTGRRPVESKRPVEERLLVRWVSNNYNQGNVVGLVDPQMDETTHPKILNKIFWLGIQCAAPIRAERPDMREVGEQLWAIRKDYLKHAGAGRR
ncbi:hypothetical protein Dimus_023475 [Dionaea muscipula]